MPQFRLQVARTRAPSKLQARSLAISSQAQSRDPRHACDTAERNRRFIFILAAVSRKTKLKPRASSSGLLEKGIKAATRAAALFAKQYARCCLQQYRTPYRMGNAGLTWFATRLPSTWPQTQSASTCKFGPRKLYVS